MAALTSSTSHTQAAPIWAPRELFISWTDSESVGSPRQVDSVARTFSLRRASANRIVSARGPFRIAPLPSQFKENVVMVMRPWRPVKLGRPKKNITPLSNNTKRLTASRRAHLGSLHHDLPSPLPTRELDRGRCALLRAGRHGRRSRSADASDRRRDARRGRPSPHARHRAGGRAATPRAVLRENRPHGLRPARRGLPQRARSRRVTTRTRSQRDANRFLPGVCHVLEGASTIPVEATDLCPSRCFTQSGSEQSMRWSVANVCRRQCGEKWAGSFASLTTGFMPRLTF